ncbi:hypothetical protein OUZ56_031811 [Daphnia magna]|uniref:Uncharacterized protein n=1 Tax=Daphnia magna TaxID=35525 RepID=A0ABQ9ZVC7_9CRUS|nr:hypothetical protein OUZ56_031811 [Daphnia magna]
MTELAGEKQMPRVSIHFPIARDKTVIGRRLSPIRNGAPPHYYTSGRKSLNPFAVSITTNVNYFAFDMHENT